MTVETVLSVLAGVTVYQIGKSVVKYYWRRRNNR